VNQRRDPDAQSAYDARWRKESKLFLRAHPMCQCKDCHGHGKPAEVVDHVIPHRGDRALFWSAWNWQPMAKACHDRKTVLEDGGFGKDPVSRGAAFVDGGGR
jgi:5-methylcytosine-specific restriction protein A